MSVADACPHTRCILIGDSEADIYELFSEPRRTSHDQPLELLIRGCQDRATLARGQSLRDHARAADCRDTATVPVSPRQALTSVETRKHRTARAARVATVEVRAACVKLRPPPRPDRTLPSVTLNIVLVAEVVLEPSEWKAVWTIVTHQTPPSTPPRLKEMIRLIASLGGYVNRSRTQPGTQTLWIGLQRMHDFADCYDTFGPNSRNL